MSPSMSDMEPPQAVHADETAKSKAAASDSTVTVIKTDKPRPHVCGTCARSFARLEHLKRHERSHTKEKPFQCPECTRCFARRDLLLRHQQKLHLTATPSRPRNGRRESTSSVANSSRVRKNSAANSAANPSSNASMRPRANTISHVDNTTLGMIAAANASVARKQNQPTHSRHPSLTNLPSSIPWSMPMGLGHHGHPHGLSNGLPKLDTNGLNIDIGGGLRTAPPYAGMGNEFDFEGFLAGPGSTVNPAQLHMSDSSHPLSMNSQSPFTQGFPNFSNPSMEEDDNFDWMTTGFDTQLNFGGLSDPNVDGSSPSAFSTASQSGVSEVMLDGSNYQMQQPSGNIWQQNGMIMPGPIITNMDFVGPEMQDMPAPPGTISPKSLHGQSMGNDPLFGIPPGLATMSPGAMGMQGQFMHNGMGFHPETPSTSSVSASGSARQSSVTSVSTGVITDATRQALLTSLSQPSVFGHNHRKYSQPSISSPLSPAFSQRTGSFSASLPSTHDLQRYITAYIDYFHPHMPFLHIPTLDFNSASTFSARPTSGYGDVSHSALHGGSGCLILAMAAIGALYEYEIGASKDLFEAAKKMIQLYLEERRKADLSAALNGTNGGHENSIQNTPLWLVQAMLLNVIYGHNCGDKTAADIASTHCAALVSLARAAELTRPVTPGSTPQTTSQHVKMEDLQISDNMVTEQNWNMYEDSIEEQWQHWKVKEERKRTLYAVFILSSMLVMAYNHTPALTNSEIRLDLPCDEDLWSAESAHNWYSRGGAQVAEQKCLPFATALSTLLTASQRQQQFPFGHFANNMMMDELPDSDVKPSALGCLILIYALHNYIWETRQRHLGRPWTHQETEAMHAHVEPALKAWQAAWASDPRHSAERPNPSGLGPLSADSIPLLDLAYVRLYVNLGRSKEAFWQRDFDGMADELARGSDVVQQTETSPSSGSSSEPPDSLHSSNASSMSPLTATSSPDMKPLTSPMMNQGMAPPVRTPPHPSYSSSKRERHLRKAAFYAANSLAMADKLGVSYADFTCRELPLQCAMAAFDCAQVLAEWVSTVQERVGRYLGILGKDDIDYGQVPGIMLLDDEDCRLLDKIVEVLNGAEAKVALDMGGTGPIGPAAALKECGFGSKILLMTAYMLDKAAVWPVTRLMARSLETQALHMMTRADYSVSNRE